MLTMEERKMMIQKIKALPGVLDATVEGLSDAQLDTPYREGGWTVRQVVHHLCDSHMHAFLRFKWMLTEENFTVKPYNQDVWATSPEYRLPVLEALHLLRGLHERWAMLLDSIDEQGWARSAEHPERGTVTMDSMLKIYSGHGEKHCMQIMGLRDRMDW